MHRKSLVALVLLGCLGKALALSAQQAAGVAGQERALALYTDLRSGRSMLVDADVLQRDALQWLTEIAQQAVGGDLKSPERARVILLSRPPLTVEFAPIPSGPVADYHDVRTGRHLFVQGTTLPATVTEWLATVNAMSDVQAVSQAIGGFRQAGLLGAQFVIGDAEITVYRGGTQPVGDATLTSLTDRRTGRVLVVSRDFGAEVEQWQRQLRDAITPIDLANLVTANHLSGLRSATMFVSGCGCEVTVAWR